MDINKHYVLAMASLLVMKCGNSLASTLDEDSLGYAIGGLLGVAYFYSEVSEKTKCKVATRYVSVENANRTIRKILPQHLTHYIEPMNDMAKNNMKLNVEVAQSIGMINKINKADFGERCNALKKEAAESYARGELGIRIALRSNNGNPSSISIAEMEKYAFEYCVREESNKIDSEKVIKSTCRCLTRGVFNGKSTKQMIHSLLHWRTVREINPGCR